MISWYLKRPSLYGELMHRVIRFPRRSVHRREALVARQEATTWCEENSSSIQEVTRALGLSEEFVHVPDVHHLDWSYALNAQTQCPVRMGGPADVDLLYNLCLHLRPERIIETGVAYGWSSLALLLALERIGRGTLVSIDRPYPLLNNEPHVGCVVPNRLHSYWRLVRQPDRRALKSVLEDLGTIDLAHYDSDKSHEGRMFAYPRIWQALRPGGVLISDDVGDNLAFRDFARQTDRRPFIIEAGPSRYVGFLVK